METKNDRPSITLLLSDFFQHTSMHGAERIVTSHEWIRKILWIILMLGALGVSSWQIHQLYSLYHKRPLATHVAIERDSVIKLFPLLHRGSNCSKNKLIIFSIFLCFFPFLLCVCFVCVVFPLLPSFWSIIYNNIAIADCW